MTYECTVTGDYGGLTLWKGDFFNCESHEQDIELRHDREINDVRGGDAKICNDGNIAARIVRTVNGSFISQLDITLTSDIAGKTIGCAYDNGTAEHRVGSLRITKG